MLNFLTYVKIQNKCDFSQTNELIREILQQWTTFFFPSHAGQYCKEVGV
jgi:hypothetical protein